MKILWLNTLSRSAGIGLLLSSSIKGRLKYHKEVSNFDTENVFKRWKIIRWFQVIVTIDLASYTALSEEQTVLG